MDNVLQSASRNRVPILLGICATGVIIGSLGPWARVFVETINGISGDGQMTLFLGVFAGVITLLEVIRHNRSHARYISMMIAFLLASLVGVNAWLNVRTTIEQSNLNASVGWGLQLMTITALAGGTVAYIQVKAISREKRHQRRLRQESAAGEAEDA